MSARTHLPLSRGDLVSWKQILGGPHFCVSVAAHCLCGPKQITSLGLSFPDLKNDGHRVEYL